MLDDREPAPKPFLLPCGGRAVFDRSSGIAYRCDSCLAVVGSVGMPRDCMDALRAIPTTPADGRGE